MVNALCICIVLFGVMSSGKNFKQKTYLGIFSGSRLGNNTSLHLEIQNIGKHLPVNDIVVVYGGGDAGIMKTIPEMFEARGGEVIGIDCKMFVDKFGKCGIGTQLTCETFHERQRTLIEKCDAYLCLPGGVGSLSELMDVLVCNDLRLHSPAKQIIVFNWQNFYSNVKLAIDSMNDWGFLKNSTCIDFEASDKPCLGIVWCLNHSTVIDAINAL